MHVRLGINVMHPTVVNYFRNISHAVRVISDNREIRRVKRVSLSLGRVRRHPNSSVKKKQQRKNNERDQTE